ncbi:group III truncated hemoglobin [Pedobacter sp. SL55]|uniref:group III truncated hemoglobin n=1 Tax=Pedobacter sp. SL55 TaxID=2995161 RepID=UPI00226EE2F4|nr:group III truncated hemoglobin [Pedobacter sp. SL55]WAC41134.1 group III truncated hemoglobin [Pedobacter sp. SL55]
MALADINSLEDIQLLVNTFYLRVRENELLGPIFNERIGDRWPEHLEKMYRFWQTVLLEVHTYTGSPFPPHAKLPVSQLHFDTWLSLWHSTIDEFFTGEKATDAKWRGDRMAEMFMYKIEYYRNNEAKPLL